MDFAFSDEQEQLRREARTFLADRYPFERVAELADSDAGWDEASWQELAGLGWIGVSVPEEAGGAGLGFLEEAVLFEELGRVLYPGPYFSTVALALPELPAELRREVVEGKTRWSAADGDGLVPDLGSSTACWSRGRHWWRRRGGRVAGHDGLDAPARPARGRRRRRGGRRASTSTAIAPALAALALEAVGIAQRALELSVEHAKTREQFGKPIGVYQAVSHRLADSYGQTELARSLAYWAAWGVAEDDDEAPLAAAAAKAYAARRRRHGLRVRDPGARRHRLHLGAPAAPLLQARAVDPGLRRLPGSAARRGGRAMLA